MSDYQKLLREIEDRNKQFQQQKHASEVSKGQSEYDDSQYVEQELEVYQKYLKEGKGRENLKIEREDALKLSSEDVEDDAKLQQAYNAVKRDVSWVHELSQTSLENLKIPDWDNSIERELVFYNDTLKSVTLSLQKLKQMGIDSLRPDDYFAEMVKSDQHMGRIKHRLLKNREVIRSRIQKRKERDYKKKRKIVQAEALKEKIQRKKDAIAAVNQWKKLNKGSTSGTFDVKEAERLYSATKNLGNVQTKAFYKQASLQKQQKTGGKKRRPGKAARQKTR